MRTPTFFVLYAALAATTFHVHTAVGAEAGAKKPARSRGQPPARYLDTTTTDPLANKAPGGVSHRFLKSGWASRSLAIVGKDGKVEWELKDSRETSDSWHLPDGGVVFSHRDGITRLSPKKETVWTYTVPKGKETHSCQPLGDGGFLVGESGDGQWMVELTADGKVRKKLKVSDHKDGRHAFRQVRKTPEGTYLATIMSKNTTYEWDAAGKLVRTFPNGRYVAIRLPNGHTVTSGPLKGKGWPIAEFDKDGKLVWSLTTDDEKALGFGLRMICGMQVLPNGNIVACNLLHGGPPDAPELFEVTRDKKVVWIIDDDRLNRVGSVQLLDVPGDVYKGQVLR